MENSWRVVFGENLNIWRWRMIEFALRILELVTIREQTQLVTISMHVSMYILICCLPLNVYIRHLQQVELSYLASKWVQQ